MLTCVGAHVVQQLHHALALHGRPVFDGRSSADLAVLLLDLRRAPLGDERAELAAGQRAGQNASEATEMLMETC